MYDSREHTLDAIAATIEVSRSTLYRHLAATDPAPAHRSVAAPLTPRSPDGYPDHSYETLA